MGPAIVVETPEGSTKATKVPQRSTAPKSLIEEDSMEESAMDESIDDMYVGDSKPFQRPRE